MPGKKNTGKRRRTPARRNPRKVVSFEKKVKKVLNDEIETKKVSHLLGGATDVLPINIQASGLQDSGYGVHIGNIWNNNNITISQGTAQNQRLGREITNCKLYLKCCIQSVFYNVSTNTNQYPFDVYCIVYKDKLSPNTSVPEQLKMNVQGGATHISGTPANFMLPWNKNRYTIYANRKVATFKPMPRDRTEAPTGSDIQNPTIGSTNNKAFRYFSMKLPCPKTLQFKGANQGGTLSSNLVSNAHLAIAFYVINGSGAALGPTQIRATVYPTATLYFKDP